MLSKSRLFKTSLSKTVFLGLTALAAIVWSMYSIWDIAPDQIMSVFLAGGILVLSLAMLALFSVSLFFLFKEVLFKNNKRNKSDTDNDLSR